MARGLNRATLIGNLGQDPEMRTTPQGSTVCTLSIATADQYKDKNGDWVDTTEWHKVVLWDKLSDVAVRFLKKGSKVYIEGKIKTRSFDGKDGTKRYVTEIVANELMMLDSKGAQGDSGSYSKSNTDSYSQGDSGSYSQPRQDEQPQKEQSAFSTTGLEGSLKDDDNEVPF